MKQHVLLPFPIEGPIFSKKAVLRTVDILRLDRSGFIRKRSFTPCNVVPTKECMTAEEACAYLGMDFYPFWPNLIRAAKRQRSV